MADFTPYIEKFHNAFKKPIWLTEFGLNGHPPVEQQMDFLKQAMGFLDAKDYVERYAWFMASPNGTEALVNTDGSLTELGKVYNNH
jgi:hypothetical protein